MSATTTPVQSQPAPQPTAQPASQKCLYCAGAGKWSKEVLPGKPEMVNCPHCHGSGIGGSSASED